MYFEIYLADCGMVTGKGVEFNEGKGKQGGIKVEEKIQGYIHTLKASLKEEKEKRGQKHQVSPPSSVCRPFHLGLILIWK